MAEGVEERRAHPRAEVPVVVDVRIGGEERVCFSGDLSVGGMRLADLHDAEPGRALTLVIHSDEPATLELEGVVVWASHTGEGSMCGIQFQDLAAADRQRLETLVHGHLDRGSDAPPEADEIRQWLVYQLRRRLDRSQEEVDPDAPLARYGLRTADADGIAHELQVWLGQEVSRDWFRQEMTLNALVQRLVGD